MAQVAALSLMGTPGVPYTFVAKEAVVEVVYVSLITVNVSREAHCRVEIGREASVTVER